MKDRIHKTNAARILDELGLPYELACYEVDEENLSAVHAAASVGENIEQVYKTLVLKGDKTGFFVCVIPGGKELDLKAAARASGNKSCEMLHGQRQQKLRNAACKRVNARYRIHTRRLQPAGHEKTFSHLH